MNATSEGLGTEPLPEVPDARTGRRFFLGLAAGVALLVLLGGFVWFNRRGEFKALAAETERLATPTVAVTHPSAQRAEGELILPGTLEAYVDAPIYARTNGYLTRWRHDIGSRVAKGELLAELDTPEIDQQLSQARAELGTAEANARLATLTSTRMQEVLKTDGVSKQEVDNAVGDAEAKAAALNSAKANVRRLQELESFKRIYAPFSGVVTRRNVDIGTLVNAGNGGESKQLFSLAQTDPIRVYVSVPEADAAGVHEGLAARLRPTAYAGQEFHGTVVRTAQALDPATRTLLTEVDVPNGDGRLLPGGFAEVHLAVKATGTHLEVPVNALLFRSEGPRVAVVDARHVAHLRPLVIGRDYGGSLEVLGGLEAGDWIVVNPADGLEDGQEVRVKEMAPANAPASPPANPTDTGGAKN